MNNKLVSIIIPVYNTSIYLEKCLNSCFTQSYTNFEVLAINDGSTDNSGLLLDQHALSESRLRVFHQKNAGVVAARNKGIENAKGEYIMFVDSDDFISSNAIELLLNEMSDNVDIVVGHYQEYFHTDNYYRRYPFKHCGQIESINFITLILLKEIQWGLWAKLYRRSIFSNLITTNFKLGEDACLLVQLVINAKRIAFIPHIIYNYLQHSDSAVHKPQNNVTDIYNFRIWIIDFLNEKRYNDISNLNYFEIDGYTEYLLMSETHELSNKSLCSKIRRLASQTTKPIANWQHLLLMSDHYGIGKQMGTVLRFTRTIIFFINKLIKHKCLNHI